MPKYLVQDDGKFLELPTVAESGGAADAGLVPELNADGILDHTILGAGTTGPDTVVLTDGSGKLSPDVLPTGVGLDTGVVKASGAIAAGSYINIFDDAGVAKGRLADAANDREAMAYVLDNFSDGDDMLVYFEGTNTQVTGATAGDVFLSTTPGRGASTPPSGPGDLVQIIGFAYAPTRVNFQSHVPIKLAAA